MKIRLLLSVILILAAAAGAEAQQVRGAEPFKLSAVQASDDSGKVYIDLNLEIKYSRLVFFREDDIYRARYRVYLQFFGKEDGKTVLGDVFSGEVTAESYSETRDQGREVYINRKVYLDPGEYRIEAAVEVNGTRIRYKRRSSINLSESDIFISNPEFYISAPDNRARRPRPGEILLSESRDMQGKFSRRESGVYTDPGSWLRSSVTISSPASTGKVAIYARVLNMDREAVSYNRGSYEAVSGKRISLNIDINVDDLEPGSYTIEVHASDGEEKAGSESFFVVLFNIESLTVDFEDTIELLSLAVSEEKIAALAESDPSERIEIWRRFWKNDGESYSLERFREKIAYAVENFSGSRPGWESDMGRIYIRNGKPDRAVERWGRWGGERYNFWYYYSLGLVYVFEDDFGTGDYRLIDIRNI